MPTREIRILYIDDDPALGRLVQKILERRGYLCEHINDAESGIDRLSQGNIDVVILDHDLGTTTGLDLLREINRHDPSPPVVYVTASSELSVAVSALREGAVDYVVKTVSTDFEVLLVSAVDRSIEKLRLMRAKELADKEIRAARDHAIVLLAEVNHRVANSLALVSSMVRLQSNSMRDAACKAALEETNARIITISNLHRSLYTSDDVQHVELGTYLTSLVNQFDQSFSIAGRVSTISIQAASVQVKTDRVVSIGMIVLELITNAVKYAYPQTPGEVRVRMYADDANIHLEVEDDGIGWHGDASTQGTGLGSKIISAMARVLSTQIDYVPVLRGTRAILSIPR
ncbi:MAG TPA: response regulator [Beijerinckiaceae bacterium]|jgi:two-component sensor histidine kinase|nr:response regulator [Beijerinckiaceae bacterium]